MTSVQRSGPAANGGGDADARWRLLAQDPNVIVEVLTAGLPVGIALYDIDLRHRFVNEPLARMRGIPAADHVGRRAPELLPDFGAEIERHLREVLEHGEPLPEMHVTGELPGRPGSEVHELRSYFPLRAPDGLLSGIGVTVVDVTERASAAALAREERDLYQALLQAQSELGEAVVVLQDLRVVLANDAAAQLAGRTPAQLEVLPSLLEVIAPDERRAVTTRIASAAAGVDPERPGFRTTVQRPDGARIPIEAAGRALTGDATGRLIVIARDITEQVTRERERERLLEIEQAARRISDAAQARMRLLADASVLLERSLEHDEPLSQLADLLSGRLADACLIEVLDAAGRRRTAARAQRTGCAPAEPGADAQEVLAIGQARIRQDASALVPLMARGRAVGLLTLAWDDPAHRSGRDEWTLIEAVAQRLALAIDSAQQFRERERVSRTLQASLLADDLPAIDGVELAAEYRPATLGTDVGGDLYDAFAIGDGAWALVIGDVCGKGAEAAAITALARYTLRALAPRVPSPADTLAILNDELLRQRGGNRFLTAALVHLEPLPGGGARVTAASGGHPPPLLLRRDGSEDVVDCTGMLLGVEPGARSTDCHDEMGPGDTLVLYTDGVTEASHEHPIDPRALALALGPHAARGPQAVAREVVRMAERAAAGAPRDDLAVLVAAVGA